MKIPVVAYDFRELCKNIDLKILENYVRECPKRPTIQILFLEILGTYKCNRINVYLYSI
jgi:hypothetical protein